MKHRNQKIKRTLVVGTLVAFGAASVQAAEYTSATGGDWEVPGNWDTATVPSAGVTVMIAGSAGGQAVVMDADSWTYITNNALNHSSTQYRTAKVLLAGTATASLDVDIGAGITWLDTSSGASYIGNASGSDGTLNVLSGICTFESSMMHIAQLAGSTGQINVTGADAGFIAGRESSGISMTVGTAGDGTFYISDGLFRSRAGVAVASSGTFDVAGSDVNEVGVGSHNSINGKWQQESNGVLRVGIDSGGITPILIDDVSFDGPDGFTTATFEDGALLEPYFIDGIETGKWTVMTVDGSISDSGLTLDNGGDTNWSFNVVSNYMLEVWYGLGDSGYTPEPPPEIVYTNALSIWDGEAGDNAWDNPTNWAFAENNVLPLQSTGNSGAIVQIDTTNNYPVYTFAQGSRDYNRLYIGVGADGRFDVLGDGYQLRFDNSGAHHCGYGTGRTGILNLDGGATLKLQASIFNIGRGNGAEGYVSIKNNSRLIVGRESGGISVQLGSGGTAYGEMKLVDQARFLTRAGVTVGDGGTGLFSVQGSGAQILIGSESSVDGLWHQYDGGTLQALVSSSGLSNIFVDDKDNDGTGADVTFESGSLLDVDFAGFEGDNGSWDVMNWEGTLTDLGLAFAPGVDTDIWSFEFVESSTNGVDTLRITASGLITEPTVQPDITTISASNDTVTLTWDSEPIVGYNVLSRLDLVNGQWVTNVAGITGMGATTTTNVPADGPQEFYKIEAFGQ